MRRATIGNHPKALLTLLLAAAVAAGLLALVGPKPAEAAFPGTNGKIAFGTGSGDGDSNIYVMNPDGSGAVPITNTGTDLGPAFSADGKKIAFTSTRDGNDEIYVMNAGGSNQTRLTNNPAGDEALAFSPDGTKIVFIAKLGAFNNQEIYVMDADGSNQTNLTNSLVAEQEPSFSPDGTKIVFERYDSGADIWIMDADGQNQTNLTGTSDGYDSVFSPDGQKIAFVSTRDGNDEIYVMDSDGTDQTRLTNNSVVDRDPAFSPDGTKIVFMREQDNPCCPGDIYVMNADGSGQTNLTNSSTRHDFTTDWGVLPTDTAPPEVDEVSPAENALKVRRNTNVVATFSEDMDRDTLNEETVTLVRVNKDGTTTPVEAAVSYDFTSKTVTLDPFPLNPTQKLAKKKQYTAKISGAKDLAGNLLPDEVWSFTTGRK